MYGWLTSNYTDCLYCGENAYVAKPCEITTAEDFVQALNLRPIHNLHASPCFGGVYMLRRPTYANGLYRQRKADRAYVDTPRPRQSRNCSVGEAMAG